jgi:hypothetical protein
VLTEPPVTTTDIQPSEFTPTERAYIRSELDQFFSTFPTVADGIQLRTWRTGERKDQPKLPPAAQSLLARDLVRLDTSGRLPRLFFTAAGLAVLRRMFADKRLADPQKFAHVRRELGIDQRGLATPLNEGRPGRGKAQPRAGMVLARVSASRQESPLTPLHASSPIVAFRRQ